MKLFLMALVGIGSLLASLTVFAADEIDEVVTTGYAEKKPAAPPDSTWTDIQRQIDAAAKRAADEGAAQAQREAEAKAKKAPEKAPERPKMERPPYCDTLNDDLLSCKKDKTKAYSVATESCSAQAVGGATVATGAGFGTQVERLGKWGAYSKWRSCCGWSSNNCVGRKRLHEWSSQYS